MIIIYRQIAADHGITDILSFIARFLSDLPASWNIYLLLSKAFHLAWSSQGVVETIVSLLRCKRDGDIVQLCLRFVQMALKVRPETARELYDADVVSSLECIGDIRSDLQIQANKVKQVVSESMTHDKTAFFLEPIQKKSNDNRMGGI